MSHKYKNADVFSNFCLNTSFINWNWIHSDHNNSSQIIGLPNTGNYGLI